ncbi:hypothetical protein [Xylanimonas ulmi]|uniref:hypothetical protein n=1 Tax=Xylanimonas ulmi TaxID=228973 RepID=UPI00102BA3BA|nr:hypothetical protein [Xylanibacterium ulmi]
MAILAALSIFSFFGIGGGWEKKVAKKLVEAYEKEHVLRRYKDQIRSYWDDTAAAFAATSDALEQEWQGFLAAQKQMVQDATKEDLEALLDAGDRLKSFLNDIPMPEAGSSTERG